MKGKCKCGYDGKLWEDIDVRDGEDVYLCPNCKGIFKGNFY